MDEEIKDDEITEEKPEEPVEPDPPEEIEPEPEKKSTSILDSVKKLLGILPEMKEFDLDILMHINSAISILSQIGVEPLNGFVVLSEEDTYEDYLGEKSQQLGPHVSLYLMYRTKLGFDPPQSSIVTECIKEAIRELECRLSYMVDPGDDETLEKEHIPPEYDHDWKDDD